MARTKKAKTPKLVPSGGTSDSSYLQTAANGIVTIAPHAATHAPAPSLTRLSDASTHTRKEDTAGAAWGNMRAPTLTTEVKRELLLVKMRGALDPKRFYRSADHGKSLPKYFQMGTVVAGSEDGWEHRLTKRERKASMLHELLADEALRKRAKTQFQKSQEAASAGVKKRHKPAMRKPKGSNKR